MYPRRGCWRRIRDSRQSGIAALTTPSRERTRAYRDRQARGAVTIVGEMGHSLAAALISSGYLTDLDSFDPRKRADALARFALDSWKGRRCHNVTRERARPCDSVTWNSTR